MRKVPDDPYGLHYSDHEGVAASFTITRLRNPVKPGICFYLIICIYSYHVVM